METITVVGSRTVGRWYSDAIEGVLNDIIRCEGITPASVITGSTRGVSETVLRWARRSGFMCEVYHPICKAHMPVSEFEERVRARNKDMVENSSLVIAFPCECSKHTKEIIKQAQGGDKIVRVIPLKCPESCEAQRVASPSSPRCKDDVRERERHGFTTTFCPPSPKGDTKPQSLF